MGHLKDYEGQNFEHQELSFLTQALNERLIFEMLFEFQVHLKFDINPYDPMILRKLVLGGAEQNQQGLAESRRPILAWLEESSSCSDLPKLEGDRYRTGAVTHGLEPMCRPSLKQLVTATTPR